MWWPTILWVVLASMGLPISVVGGLLQRRNTWREAVGGVVILVGVACGVLGFFQAARQLDFHQGRELPSSILVGLCVASIGLLIGEFRMRKGRR